MRPATAIALVLPAVLLAPSAGGAQERRPVAAEDLYRLQFASGIALSPDGRRIAYVVSRADSADNTYRSELWLASSDGSSNRRLTWTENAGESQPAFSPDGRSLAFVSRRDDAEGPRIYVLPLGDGGEARPLAAPEGGAFSPVWSPDGRRIAFLSSVDPDTTEPPEEDPGRPLSAREKLDRNARAGNPVVLDRLDFRALASFREESWDQLFVIDVHADGAEPVQLTSGPFPHGSIAWTRDGRSILYSAARPKGDYHPDYELDSDIWRIPAEAGSHHDELTGTDAPDPGALAPGRAGRLDVSRPGQWAEFAPTASPDGRRVAYLRSSLESYAAARNTELAVMAADGSGTRCVSCDLDRSVGRYWWDDDGGLYFTVADRGAVPLYRTGPDLGAPRKGLDGPRGVLDFAVAGSTVAWVEMSPGNPSEVWATDRTGTNPRRITRLNDELLAGLHVQPYEEIEYAAPDGTAVQGWVIRPPGFQPGAHPLAVEMHGGPHAMWGPGEQSMWHEYQMLAGAGYVVFLSNPRGSEGYGFDWKHAIHRNWGELPMGDVLAGADEVLRRGWADPERQVITGGSYAGYLTAWIIGHTDRFRAAVAQRGVYHMMSWYGGSFTWRLYESEFSSVPWEDPMLAWRASPLAYVADIRTPLLLIHGERDFTATIAGAAELYRALKVLGREVEFAWYPNASHELSRSGVPRERIDRLLRIQDFFDRHVGPAR